MTKRKDVQERITNKFTIELSERYSAALTVYLDTVNKVDAARPYPHEPLSPTFLLECALRQFWFANRRDLPDLVAFNTVTEVRRGK